MWAIFLFTVKFELKLNLYDYIHLLIQTKVLVFLKSLNFIDNPIKDRYRRILNIYYMKFTAT